MYHSTTRYCEMTWIQALLHQRQPATDVLVICLNWFKLFFSFITHFFLKPCFVTIVCLFFSLNSINKDIMQIILLNLWNAAFVWVILHLTTLIITQVLLSRHLYTWTCSLASNWFNFFDVALWMTISLWLLLHMSVYYSG